MIRAEARKWTITIQGKGSWKSKKIMTAKLKLFDDNGGNILKVRRCKGRLKSKK